MNITNKSVNSLRVLSCQTIQKANSGHPGIALGSAPIVYSLYANILNVSPNYPTHMLRDRFVLSAGHGSAMLYSALHLFGFKLSINDLKEFRQLNSHTPGHPEVCQECGIESTTGPLGQGVANAVGMAMAERHLASVFNKPDLELFNNYTYALVGDGCLMEGVANEALSLAGTQKLNKLIVLYDFNKITIDGSTDYTFKQKTKTVFKGYGFNVIEVKNGNSVSQITNAIKRAQHSTKPTLIIVNTIIGFGSVLAGTEKVHGAPLGVEGMQALQQTLQINTADFEILPEVSDHYKFLQQRFYGVGSALEHKLNQYKQAYPQDYKKLMEFLAKDYSNANTVLKPLLSEKEMLSTREAGGMVLATLSKEYENIFGGTADLSSSTKTIIKNSGKFMPDSPEGRNIMFGIREFAMSTICNGIALYGGLTPFASTFYVFSDYLKSGARLSALMSLKVLYIFTHDSIGVGEDGPTHQSVEQLTTFRATPNTTVFRPANLQETKAGFVYALNNNAPTHLILTRQNILNFESSIEDALKGGYILSDAKNPQAIIIATGSEVEIALSAQQELEKQGVPVRVVSMPSQEIFNEQSAAYKNKVLSSQITNRVAIEAGSTLSWFKYVGLNGAVLGIDQFGKSGKYTDVYNHFGLNAKTLVKTVLSVIKNNK